MTTHLQYIKKVAKIATARLPKADRSKLDAQLTYSMGVPGLRGVTYYGAWKNGGDEPVPFIEVCAAGEENDVQLAGTTIHELAHVLAGCNAGHSNTWKIACAALGLNDAIAAGHVYEMEQFEVNVRHKIAALDSPTDGKPVGMIGRHRIGTGATPRACPVGIGTRGGKSRGIGSGSRMRRFTCACTPPVIVRASRDELAAHCDLCTGPFVRS